MQSVSNVNNNPSSFDRNDKTKVSEMKNMKNFKALIKAELLITFGIELIALSF